MNFTDYLLFKAIALVVLVFFANLIYTYFTGKSIEQVRRDRAQAPTHPEGN